MQLTSRLRSFVPSVAPLTYKAPFRLAVDALDWPARLLFPQFRHLPPNHLRVRIGVGNRLLFNQPLYSSGAKEFWMAAFANHWCTPDSIIVDIGCGCGRYAAPLRDFRFAGTAYQGKYYGIDIDEEMLSWCREHFDSDRFEFCHATGRSSIYSPMITTDMPYALPLLNFSTDFVFSTSLFTHLLEQNLRHYVHEAFRVLRRNSYTVHTFFSVDHPPRTLGSRHTFGVRIDNAHVESARRPEAAVAYPEQFLKSLFVEAGFSDVSIFAEPQQLQQVLVARKPAE